MSETTTPTGNKSEVARLREQIRLELESSQRGLNGLSSGSTRHEFISAKYDRLGALQEELSQFVGEEGALQTIIDLGNELIPDRTETREGGNLCLTTTEPSI